MDGLEIDSKDTKVIISLDMNIFNFDAVKNALDYLKTALTLQEANFDPAVVEFGQQLKRAWWKKNKEAFLS